MSRHTSKHATLVSGTKSPPSFPPDFYTSQTYQSCLEHTSPWTSLVHYHLHNGTEFGMTLFLYTKTILMDGLKHGQQVLMLLEKISQTCTSPTYSHRQDYLNQSSAIETPNSPPNSSKPLCNASKLNWTCQLPFTHKQTDQQKLQTKPSFKYYEIGYQRNKITGHNTYHLSHTQSTYPQTIQQKCHPFTYDSATNRNSSLTRTSKPPSLPQTNSWMHSLPFSTWHQKQSLSLTLHKRLMLTEGDGQAPSMTQDN